MTTLELIEYYSNLLILQYTGKPNAVGTIEALVNGLIMPQTSVQTITFSSAPTSGAFALSYNGVSSASIAFNDGSSTVQSKLRAITGLSSVTVAGSISGLVLTVTFSGVTPPALSLQQSANTLLNGGLAVTIAFLETDEIIPLAVQDAFNLILGTTQASGVQLDVIGQYCGVARSGKGFTTNITLNDADFLSLIRMAIIKNSAGSSLSIIQNFIYQFFPNEMYVVDNADMTMDYVISQGIGSNDLIQLFVSEGLLPKPMAVQITAIINPPSLNLFSFRTYLLPAPPMSSPFNTYSSYSLSAPWLSYQYVI